MVTGTARVMGDTCCQVSSSVISTYIIHNETLRAVPVATHLGIDISNNLSWNPHIYKIVNKANSKLGFIKRNLKSIPQSIKTYARFVVHNYSWETSGSTLASALSWPTLEQRRAEARLTTMYKITNNLLDINPNQYLMPGHSQTRSTHPHKYRQILTSHNYPVLQIQFFPRTIAQWNRLPSSVFAHNSLDTFKGALQDINLTIAPFRHLQ